MREKFQVEESENCSNRVERLSESRSGVKRQEDKRRKEGRMKVENEAETEVKTEVIELKD